MSAAQIWKLRVRPGHTSNRLLAIWASKCLLCYHNRDAIEAYNKCLSIRTGLSTNSFLFGNAKFLPHTTSVLFTAIGKGLARSHWPGSCCTLRNINIHSHTVLFNSNSDGWDVTAADELKLSPKGCVQTNVCPAKHRRGNWNPRDRFRWQSHFEADVMGLINMSFFNSRHETFYSLSRFVLIAQDRSIGFPIKRMSTKTYN